jgi:hypothetical protein
MRRPTLVGHPSVRSCLGRNGAAVALSLLVTMPLGCAETRLYSGHPPGDIAADHDARFHDAYLFGTTDGEEPYELSRICPQGWSEIRIAPDFFTAVLSVTTLFLYTPNRLTIVCAGEPVLPAPAPPPSGVSTVALPGGAPSR